MRLAAIIALALSLTACGPAYHPVAWYKAHPAEIDKALSKCNDTFVGLSTPPCQNAVLAQVWLENPNGPEPRPCPTDVANVRAC